MEIEEDSLCARGRWSRGVSLQADTSSPGGTADSRDMKAALALLSLCVPHPSLSAPPSPTASCSPTPAPGPQPPAQTPSPPPIQGRPGQSLLVQHWLLRGHPRLHPGDPGSPDCGGLSLCLCLLPCLQVLLLPPPPRHGLLQPPHCLPHLHPVPRTEKCASGPRTCSRFNEELGVQKPTLTEGSMIVMYDLI